ncbi:PREDICTED: uncharacterized protein LOC104606757 [Nelumbo nucifera]|uniref:Uncharacterized protein LOC104606757 n=2 Tax=Nelumbo nucifera TaxID=4432 RepID=A0A1U8B3Y3_NELNU|nr:PREDICTED: uncharacterized protein LOC104606757 [Nelumbo nucifera]DAD39912.1 TPA_asm: hypothetical protein HUJ06_014235 [Nelumbo nucifera]
MDKCSLQIERKSSIENEPRTLTIDQLQFAREEALCVLNTRGIEEAIRIFTEGLKPVVSSACQKRSIKKDSDEEFECFATQLKLPRLRDVVSAPF